MSRMTIITHPIASDYLLVETLEKLIESKDITSIATKDESPSDKSIYQSSSKVINSLDKIPHSEENWNEDRILKDSDYLVLVPIINQLQLDEDMGGLTLMSDSEDQLMTKTESLFIENNKAQNIILILPPEIGLLPVEENEDGTFKYIRRIVVSNALQED